MQYHNHNQDQMIMIQCLLLLNCSWDCTFNEHTLKHTVYDAIYKDVLWHSPSFGHVYCLYHEVSLQNTNIFQSHVINPKSIETAINTIDIDQYSYD